MPDCLLKIILIIIEIVMIMIMTMMTSVVNVTSVIPVTRKGVFSVGVTGYQPHVLLKLTQNLF